MSKYRIWLDHPESDCHQWASDLIHTDHCEAARELEQLQDTGNDGFCEYCIINLDTGYPAHFTKETAEQLGHTKRT